MFWKQGRLEPVETHVKNNKRGLGADKAKKKVVKAKPDQSDSSKGNNQQVIFSFGFTLFLCFHRCKNQII